MPLSDYSETELLQELLQRATKRTELALEGPQIEDLSKVSYREVVPVEGQPVPPGCEFTTRSVAYGKWCNEALSRFRTLDVLQYEAGTWKWRAPVSPEVVQ